MLLLVYTAGGMGDNVALAYNELDQLNDKGAESLEQSLVRRGEMTPFGTVLNTTVEVKIHYISNVMVLVWLSW